MGQSSRIFEIGHEAQQRYDYFLAGLAAALTGYVGQNFAPFSIELYSSEAVEALAIVLFIGAFVGAITRIRLTTDVLKLNHSKLELNEKFDGVSEASADPHSGVHIPGVGIMSSAQASDLLPTIQESQRVVKRHLERRMGQAIAASYVRDILLIMGFAALLIARILGADPGLSNGG